MSNDGRNDKGTCSQPHLFKAMNSSTLLKQYNTICTIIIAIMDNKRYVTSTTVMYITTFMFSIEFLPRKCLKLSNRKQNVVW